MSGSSQYEAPNITIPYQVPASVPSNLTYLFAPIYNAFQMIIQTLITYCGIAPRNPATILSSLNDPTAILTSNAHRFYTIATETIAAGAAINLYAIAGAIAVRNANATDNTKPIHGFCSQTGGLALGAVGEVILSNGVNTQVSGLTVGAEYYLSTTSGAYTTSPPSAAGNLQQYVGIALASNVLYMTLGTRTQH